MEWAPRHVGHHCWSNLSIADISLNFEEMLYIEHKVWPWSNIKCLTSIGNSIVEIRWSYDCFISTMGFLYWWYNILYVLVQFFQCNLNELTWRQDMFCFNNTSAFYPRPVLAFGYCPCLRVCVCVSVRQSWACPCDNSSTVQARITKFGSEM